MTHYQAIIKELDYLDEKELEMVMEQIKARLDKRKLLEQTFAEFVGVGKGFWEVDAQEYVNVLRGE